MVSFKLLRKQPPLLRENVKFAAVSLPRKSAMQQHTTAHQQPHCSECPTVHVNPITASVVLIEGCGTTEWNTFQLSIPKM